MTASGDYKEYLAINVLNEGKIVSRRRSTHHKCDADLRDLGELPRSEQGTKGAQ